MEKIKPVLVLALIAAVISGLVIGVYTLTYQDTSKKVTDKEAAALGQIFGSETKTDYRVLSPSETVSDGKTYQDLLKDKNITNVDKVFKKNDGSLGIKCIVKGYKNGFEIMVGINETDDGASIAGVSIVSVGEETPGLGTKTNDAAWLGNFKGSYDKAEIVKTASDEAGKVQAVTSATYSSKGVASAVNVALEAYPVLKDLPDSLFKTESDNGGESQ